MSAIFLSNNTGFGQASVVPRLSIETSIFTKAMLIGTGVLMVAGALLLRTVPVMANEGLPVSVEMVARHDRQIDQAIHTQRTLNEMKNRLGLAPSQIAVWVAWSQGVLADGRWQVEYRNNASAQRTIDEGVLANETTPQKMARGVERLKFESAQMQEHLAQLEAAHARTGALYEILDADQRTTFDLFWYAQNHGAPDGEQGGGMPGHRRQPAEPPII
ncbi:MAG TPA: hypothetical protein VIF60_07845 [Burkholderiaceae bacterium]|jgi:hypothetical protein